MRFLKRLNLHKINGYFIQMHTLFTKFTVLIHKIHCNVELIWRCLHEYKKQITAASSTLIMLPTIIAKIATYRMLPHHYRTLRHTCQAECIYKSMLIESLPIRFRISQISSSFWLSSFASVRLWIYWEFNRFYFTVENGKQFGLTQRLIVLSWLAPLAFSFVIWM